MDSAQTITFMHYTLCAVYTCTLQTCLLWW